MGMGEKRDIYFAILNKNPIAVTLRGWGANLTGSLVEVIGVDQGNETEILERASFEGMTRKLIIPTGHYLIFRLGIHTTEVEGAFDGYVYVETSYHTFKVCVRDCPSFYDQVGHQTTILLEISIFSLNIDIVGLTKIMNNVVKDPKILSFKVIFQCLKLVESFQKKIL